MYALIGRFGLDITALITSAVVLAVGIYLSWHDAAVWLNRTGSIIIVIGVLVAACRFHDRMQSHLSEKAEENEDALFEKVKLKLEIELGEQIKPESAKDLRPMVRETFQKEITSLVEIEKRRIKLLEVLLVVGGTLLNGFGDYAVCLLKVCP